MKRVCSSLGHISRHSGVKYPLQGAIRAIASVSSAHLSNSLSSTTGSSDSCEKNPQRSALAEWQTRMRTLAENRVLFNHTRHSLASEFERLGSIKEALNSSSQDSSGDPAVSVCTALGQIAFKSSSADELVAATASCFKAWERQYFSKEDVSSVASVAVHTLLSALRFEDSQKVADLPFFYIGRAIRLGGGTDDLYTDALLSAALLQVTAPLFDKWVESIFSHYVEKKSPLPFRVVHGIVTYTSQAQDIERTMNLYHRCKEHGIQFNSEAGEGAVQGEVLKLLVKVGSCVRRTDMDGGIKHMMLAEIKASVPRDVIYLHASWGVLHDLMALLGFDSAVKLIKQAAGQRGGDGSVPFFMWASLLRMAAKRYLIDETENLFHFIRKRFQLTSLQKSELVEVVMRMYASASPAPDFASATALFLEHVVDHPAGEPPIAVSGEHYKLLLRASDSRNAAAMVFLESCASGISIDEDAFASLYAKNPQSSLSALSKKLPHEYGASQLDATIRIPADVDAHARREEALLARKKPCFDSTTTV